jgi:ADP-ribose pyrophosphatase
MNERRKNKARRTVYTGTVFRVERETVTLPHGAKTTMDIVRHRGSVVLLPQPDPASVVLIRHYRHVLGRYIWELPAGTLEAGEKPSAAAKRECEEEIGLRPARVVKLGAYYATPGFCDELMTFFGCYELKRPRSPKRGDEDEHIEPRTFTLDEIDTLIARGEIIDMKTVVGLDLVRRKKRD